MAIELTACEFCGESESTLLFPATPGIEEMDPAPFYAANNRGGQNAHFAIVCCNKCGLGRSQYRDDQETRASLQRQTGEDENEIKNQILTCKRRARLLSRSTIPGGVLLDINCSTGRFTGEMMRQGWQAVGIDPSDWATSQAREMAPWAQFYVAEVEKAIFPASSFDVITFWDGLDHVNSPHTVLERLTSWLEPGGLLLLNLPDITSLEARLLGAAWPALLRQHLWYFSPFSIKRLLGELGYELVSIQPTQSRHSLAKAASRLKFAVGWPGTLGHLINLPGQLGRLSFWFSPGEMLVTARLKILK